MPEAMHVDDNARKIARVLRLHYARPIVGKRVDEVFHEALRKALADPDAGTYPELESARLRPEAHRRNLETCMSLLNHLWLVPAGSRLEERVVDLMQRCYRDCSVNKTHLEIVREAVRERQWHPFPVVRRAACHIRMLEPVDGEEAATLTGRGHPELRTAVAERVLFLHQQAEYFPPALGYLVSVIEGPVEGVDDDELTAVKALVHRLHEVRIEILVRPLWSLYVEHFESTKVRGILMRVLSRAGDRLVPVLVDAFRTERPERRPVLRLLQQLVAFGSLDAARAMGDIIFEALDPALLPEAVTSLLRALRSRLAFHQGNVAALREYCDQLAVRLESAPTVQQRHLAQELRGMSWRRQETQELEELVERVVTGVATQEEVNNLRHGGPDASERLAGVFEDPARPENERRQAVVSAGRLFGAAAARITGKRLWATYRVEPSVEVRCCILRVLADMPFDADDRVRDRLATDATSGEPALGECILEVWSSLFPKAPLPA